MSQSPKPPELATDVVVFKRGKTSKITIDGVDFPYYLSTDDVVATVKHGNKLKQVTLNLLFKGDLLVHEDNTADVPKPDAD